MKLKKAIGNINSVNQYVCWCMCGNCNACNCSCQPGHATESSHISSGYSSSSSNNTSTIGGNKPVN